MSITINTTVAQSSFEIDMTKELSSIKGHLIIDGNQLQSDNNTRAQIVIRAHNLVLSHRSSILLRNVILKLTGSIFIKGDIKIRRFSSYILSKKKSTYVRYPNIIRTKNLDRVIINNVSFISKIQGDPIITIYDMTGKKVIKGKKSDIILKELPVSKYDVRVSGKVFNEGILFVNKK